MSEFQKFVQKSASGKQLTASEMSEAMNLLLNGGVDEIEIAGFLMALRMRGETIEEITAAAKIMREKTKPVQAPDNAVDTCGTGGDGANTYNISTGAAFVAAGCGVAIAKHGNKAASSKSGSSEVLTALGVNIEMSAAQFTRCISETGFGFLYAAQYHQAVRHVSNVRQKLGVRTIFNLLGPLSNPAGARRQIMGVFSRDLVEPLARVLQELGARKAWVVHGEDGLDEITTTGRTFVCEVTDDEIKNFTIHPADAGLKLVDISALKGGDPAHNAGAITRMLKGESGAFRDICLINASAALIVSEKASTLKEGVDQAAAAIDTGRAREVLEDLVKFSYA